MVANYGKCAGEAIRKKEPVSGASVFFHNTREERD